MKNVPFLSEKVGTWTNRESVQTVQKITQKIPFGAQKQLGKELLCSI